MESIFPEKGNQQPEECLLHEIKNNQRLVFGIPKENQAIETRLPLTPEAVSILVEEGHEVLIESGAGLGMNYTDLRYTESGATIVETAEDAFSADIVFKIAPPTPQEVALMNDRAAIFSLLQLSLFSKESIKLMIKKKIMALSYELIKDHQRNFPVMSSISEIEGSTAISIAAQYMSNENGGKGLLLGGIAGVSATEVMILGAGIAGSAAARSALALGAQVKIFDHDINKLRKLQQQLGQHVFTSVIHPRVLFKALASADAVIGTLRYINGSERFMVSEDLVRTMKKGAVIRVLSVDQGGCFETSECRNINNPVYERCGVIHYCVPNISSRVGRTASMALSNIFAPMA
jgi:alanine dehydrogenase